MTAPASITHSPAPWDVRVSHVPGFTRTMTIVSAEGIAVAKVDGAGSFDPNVLCEVEGNAQLLRAAPEAVAALRRLVAQVENTLSDSEGCWPAKDSGCQWCTEGNTPARFDRGPCAYHEAKRLLAAIDKEVASVATR